MDGAPCGFSPFFDLPVETKKQRRAYARFRKDLLEDGFSMMQYSVYYRHCASHENAVVHVNRMGKCVPAEGEVRFMVITDKQFSKIRTFVGRARQAMPDAPAQMEMF
jgi:CRISPR-associated protein Cas2